MSGRRKARGFTLIELLVAIAVIAIAVGIGVPAWSNFSQGSAVSGATSELVAAMNDARSLATAERTTIQLRAIGGNWNRGFETYRLSDGELLFSVVRTDGGKVNIVEDNDETDVSFDRAGRLTAARGFDIGIAGAPQGTQTRRLNISAFGRVQIVPGTAP